MNKNSKLKQIDIKNHTSCYFNDIISINEILTRF